MPTRLTGTDPLLNLATAIQHAVAEVEELKLEIDQVSVFFPADRDNEGRGGELIALVEGLFKKPERTFEVRQMLAVVIMERLRAFAMSSLSVFGPGTGWSVKIEVLVKQFDPEKDGFAESTVRG